MPDGGGYDAQALHGFAHDSIARGSKSFALASQLFDRITRERVWLLYAGTAEISVTEDSGFWRLVAGVNYNRR